MKKLFSVSVLCSFLVSCTGYETLDTPFQFFGDKNAVEKLAIENKQAAARKKAVEGFEVSIKAPAGTPMETAYNIFNKEANRVCRGGKYTYEITSQGNADTLPANPADTGNLKLPYVTGIVVCKSNSPVSPTETESASTTPNDLTRSRNTLSAPIRASSTTGMNLRGTSIPGRTMPIADQFNMQNYPAGY